LEEDRRLDGLVPENLRVPSFLNQLSLEDPDFHPDSKFLHACTALGAAIRLALVLTLFLTIFAANDVTNAKSVARASNAAPASFAELIHVASDHRRLRRSPKVTTEKGEERMVNPAVAMNLLRGGRAGQASTVVTSAGRALAKREKVFVAAAQALPVCTGCSRRYAGIYRDRNVEMKLRCGATSLDKRLGGCFGQ